MTKPLGKGAWRRNGLGGPKVDPPGEYDHLPPVLVQIEQKLHPQGIMWAEISRPSTTAGSGGRVLLGSGSGSLVRGRSVEQLEYHG